MTDEPQTGSPAKDEPVTEERLAVTEVRPDLTSEPATAVESPPVPEPPPSVVPPRAATRPPIPPPVPPVAETEAQPSPSPVDKVTALVAERPEVGVGGAFAGGAIIALILKRLGR